MKLTWQHDENAPLNEDTILTDRNAFSNRIGKVDSRAGGYVLLTDDNGKTIMRHPPEPGKLLYAHHYGNAPK